MEEEVIGLIAFCCVIMGLILSIAIPVTICVKAETNKEIEIRRMELEYQYNNGDYTNE